MSKKANSARVGDRKMAKGKYLEWVTEEGLALLSGWARDGLTDEQIAHNIGISRSKLNEWKKRYPDISDTLKRGKEVVDRIVENAMIKNATGYDYEEVTYVTVEMGREEHDELVDAKLDEFDEQYPDASREERLSFIASIPKTKEVVSKRVTKHKSPETLAQIFWLKNRMPDQWRDNHSGWTVKQAESFRRTY